MGCLKLDHCFFEKTAQRKIVRGKKNTQWFVSVDPLQFDYPELTPFQYASNNPVTMIDLDGLEGVKPEDKPAAQSTQKTGNVQHFYNPNETIINKKTQEEKFRNAELIPYAEHFRDNLDNGNAIHIFAHGAVDEKGNVLGISTYKDGKTKTIGDVEQFEKFLSENFEMWSNKKEGEHITIVLHSCLTGKGGENSFAAKMSKDLDNTTIIAPTRKQTVIIYEDGTQKEEVSTYVPATNWKGEATTRRLEGVWGIYQGGKQIDTLSGNSSPMAKDMSQKNIFQKMFDATKSRIMNFFKK